jgi:6-phosphogluconolactonase (cycloisomerase 2 family)
VDQLNSITLSPSGTVNVPLGSTQSFVAIGNFTFAAGGSGNLDVSSQATWNSSNMAVATIDTSGNATTVGTGTTTITATSCDGITVGTATLTVGAAAATSLVITPATITISTGTTTLFTAMEMLSNGTTQPTTGVTWASGTTTVATIDPISGVALGVTAGTSAVTITATETSSGLTGTASLTVQAATARFAYIANIQGNGVGGAPGSGSISVYSVDVTQPTPVTQVTGSPFPASNPQQVLIHPSGDLMYYINASSRILTEFVTSGTGSFVDSGRIPSTAGTGGTNVGVIDPLGRFIYVIEDSGTIYGFSIAQTQTQSTNGVLTAIFGPTGYTDPTLTLNVPSWVMTDRAGKYLYVVTSASNSVSEYSINQSTGALTPLSSPTIATGASPNFATTDMNGHIFVANSGDNTVSVFSIDSTTGLLTQVPQTGGGNFPVTGATIVSNVLTDPTGKYLYVLDSTTGPPPSTAPLSHVFAFNLNPATGVIGAQIGTPQLTGNSPIGMAIDPTGVLLAIDNNFDSTISLFTVSTSTGAVTPTSPPTVPTDLVPQFVVFYTAASDQ